jgi:heparan-alpha-glucosaminide N-acetyltransferase
MFHNYMLIKNIINIGPFLGTHAAICVSGAALGKLVSENIHGNIHVHRLFRALLLGAGFALVGFMLHSLKYLHSMFKISKLSATPSWGLISSALVSWAWAFVYIVSDISKWKIIPRIVEYAGRNALMAYILSIQLIFGINLLGSYVFQHDFYRQLAGSIGLWRSVCFSVFIVLLAGILERFKVRLKL